VWYVLSSLAPAKKKENGECCEDNEAKTGAGTYASFCSRA
jgi:hypothetical protein